MTTATFDSSFDRGGVKFALWYALFIGPISWAFDEQLSYSLVAHSCSTGHFYLMHVIGAICLLFALSGVIIGARWLARSRNADISKGTPAARTHFMALMGVIFSVTFIVLMIAQSVPRFMLSPCE